MRLMTRESQSDGSARVLLMFYIVTAFLECVGNISAWSWANQCCQHWLAQDHALMLGRLPVSATASRQACHLA
jgi:drug/metabolite transporter superfamily protein YnfA